MSEGHEQWGNHGRWLPTKRKFRVATIRRGGASDPPIPAADLLCWPGLKRPPCGSPGCALAHMAGCCASQVAHLLGQRAACDGRRCSGRHPPPDELRAALLAAAGPGSTWEDGGLEPAPLPPSAISAAGEQGEPADNRTSRTGRSLDLLLERIRSEPNPNKYLAEFAGAGWVETLLTDSRFHSLAACKAKGLEKEVTEAMSAIAVLSEHNALEPGTVVFDLCCGKGFTSALLALSHPEVTIKMVDLDGAMNLRHVTALPNCQFHYGDVFGPEIRSMMVPARPPGAQPPAG